MAGGNTAYDWRDFMFDTRGTGAPGGSAGLGDAPGPSVNPDMPKSRLNLSFAPEVVELPPSFSVANRDVRKTFGVGFRDQLFNTPEWRAAKSGAAKAAAEKKAAEDWLADKPAAERDLVRNLDDEIKAGKDRIKKATDAEDWPTVKAESERVATLEAEASRRALENTRKASDPNRLYAGANAEQKKAADEIARFKKERGKAWDAKKTNMKNIAKGGAATALLGGAAYLGGQLMSDAEEKRRSDPTKVAVDDVVMRVLSGEEVSPDEIYMMEQFYADDPDKVAAILRTGEEVRGGAAPVEPPPAAAPEAPASPPVGPRIENLPLTDVAYREGAEKPAVVRPTPTYDPEVMRAILEDPEGGPEVAQWYKDNAEAEDLRRRNNAFLDASIENTAAAAGSPDWFLDYLRGQGEQSRAVDAGGELPVSDNWWNNYVVPTVRASDEGWQRLYGRIDEAFPDDPATFWENPIGYTRNAMVPESWQDAIDGALEGVTPQDMLGINFLLGQTTDEMKNLPYSAVRDGILSPTFYAGVLEDPALSAAYGEAMRSMGGEPLRGPDPITAPITQGAAPPAFWDPGIPPELNAGADAGVGVGAYDTGMPSMEDLKRLEEIGALGANPDGSNMTVAQYIQQGNLAGAGMQAGLPMFAGSPMPVQRGTVIPEDPRLGLMPVPQLPQLPMAPSDMPIEARVPQGTPGSFLDENAGDFRRADNEWNKLATMLGLTPTGEPVRGGAGLSAPVAPLPAAPAAPVTPGGAGDQWALSNPFGSPAVAGEVEDARAAEEIARYNEEVAKKDEAVSALVDQDEVLNPRGQSWTSGPSGQTWGAGLSSDAGALSMGSPAASAPVVATPMTPGGNPAPGAKGDFNVSRERGAAGLAEDAEAAEEELNWINRMMRDKLGMTDASQRNKAAEALISFGSSVLASRGDDWQALGEGLQAGYGTVTQINDEEAAALAAQQEAILEENRWRAEMALKELAARKGAGVDGMPDKLAAVEETAAYLALMYPALSEQEIRAMAERYVGIKSEAAWANADPFAFLEGVS